jgi:hypothetical protein
MGVDTAEPVVADRQHVAERRVRPRGSSMNPSSRLEPSLGPPVSAKLMLMTAGTSIPGTWSRRSWRWASSRSRPRIK